MTQLIPEILNLCNLSYINPIGASIGNYIIDSNDFTLFETSIRTCHYLACYNLLNDIKSSNKPFYIKYKHLLILAFSSDNEQIINLILKSNIHHSKIIDNPLIDSKYMDKYKITAYMRPLSISAMNGNINLCKILINKYRCSINGKYKNGTQHLSRGFTPLISAVYSGNHKLVKFLLKQGANPNIWTFGFSMYMKKSNRRCPITALHIAIEQKEYKIIKLLLSYGANAMLEYTVSTPELGVTATYMSAFELLLKIINTRIKYLKLFKIMTNCINHEQYISIRNMIRLKKDINIQLIPNMNGSNKFKITEQIINFI